EGAALACPGAPELAAELRARAVTGLCLDGLVRVEDLTQLVEALSRTPDELTAAGGVRRGFELGAPRGISLHARAPAAPPRPPPPAAAPAPRPPPPRRTRRCARPRAARSRTRARTYELPGAGDEVRVGAAVVPDSAHRRSRETPRGARALRRLRRLQPARQQD